MNLTQSPVDVNPGVREARKWAAFYQARGYQALPSASDRKRPLVRYGEWWEGGAPGDLFDRHPSTNIQVMTGRHWGLIVFDLDGPEAIGHWPSLAPCCPRTWITHSGGGGRHVWFTIPRDLPPIPKARLWGEWDSGANGGKGDWVKRKNIERLCDRSLVMAPPSVHPTTGRRYRFLAGQSPKEIPRPAPCPRRLLAIRPVSAPRPAAPLYVHQKTATPFKAPGVAGAPPADSRAVLDAIHDKAALAQSWGLRLASSRPNAAGWCSCHAVGREDRDPSASFNPETGRYWESGAGSVGLFDLSVLLGAYADWRDAKDDLAARFLPRRNRTHSASNRFASGRGMLPSPLSNPG